MSGRRCRGWALMEATFALLVLAILLSGMHVAGAAESRFARDAARRDAVRESAAEILERARAARDALAPGEQAIDVGIAGASATRTVREIAPGLMEVKCTVRDGDFDATLTTLLATEAPR